MNEFIKSDLYRYNASRGYKQLILHYLKWISFRWCVLFRLYQNGGCCSLMYRLLLHRYSLKYGFQISHKTRIDAGFRILHHGNIVVNGNAVIGKNCTLSQGVTIGRANRGNKEGEPILGNRVWVGANAVIVGKVTIGNNVMIAPLSYVNVDVPSNSIVIGNPAQIIPSENATLGYINSPITE